MVLIILMPKRKKTKGKKSSKGQIFVFYRYVIVAVFVLVLGTFVVKLIPSLFTHSSDGVLGSSIFLAKGGDDDGGSSNSGSGGGGDDHDDDDNSGSGSSNSGPSSSTGNSQTVSSVGGVSGGTRVECVGPDGKIFRTTFGVCEDLNESWGNANFQFTVTSSGSNATATRVFDVDSIDEDEDEIDEVEIGDEDESGIRVKTEPEKTEIKISESERIRARTKDGRTRIDITSGGVKTRLEYRDDRVIVKAEIEDGTENELEDDTIFKIDDRLEASGIKIATNGAEGFIIHRGNAGAVTEFPLSIDLATNTLSVNTPAGEKQVDVLPDQAIENLLTANVINNLVKTQALNASEIENIDQIVTLGENQGELVYQIQGISNQKLLGFIPVVIERTVTVSAEDGGVVQAQEPLLDRILDVISF